jgi:hypothetical protein
MTLAPPKPGQVIRYAYLWWNEARAGREDGVEIPRATKQRLGLDKERSWIITTELNRFVWPGPDLRPTATGDYLYGYLPEKLMHLVLKSVKKNARGKRLKAVPRTK